MCLTNWQQDTIRRAAEALDGLDHEDTAGDLRAILRAAPAVPVVTIMGDGAVEERIKTLMANIGMPDNTSLYTAMKQLQNEIEQGIKIVSAGEVRP